ncbi:hypothetical protein GGR56DRAFT_671460 [Xylariaceae sp. FL0804]|nr:hypothetical protein GGR56DRAFT_671460 [Xylariaceae sp. FL0804]
MTVKPRVPSGESCCTCATRLAEVPRLSEATEKPLPQDRRLECCPRVICGKCIHDNARFETYCPYCQISITSSTLPPGLKEPPSYQSIAGPSSSSDAKPFLETDEPPPYTPSSTNAAPLDSKSGDAPAPPDTVHFLNHDIDSVTSLSLAYGVPAAALRRTNNITSDHLLLARRTILIPGEFYRGGVSLSPRPVEGEEEEARKAKIRRWMVACKVHEYDVAVLYLEQVAYDLEAATEAYFADEEWERSHPANSADPGKGILRGSGRNGRRVSGRGR